MDTGLVKIDWRRGEEDSERCDWECRIFDSRRCAARQDVLSGAIYCSQNDLTLHFGLGAATKVDKLEIKWANGSVENFDVPAVDRIMTITQGK